MAPAHGLKMTATADVKLKNGTTKHVTHTSEWPALKEAKEYKRCSQLYLTMELPVVENAAEDFQWTITVSFDLKSDECYRAGSAYYTREQTNIDQYCPQWKSLSYRIWDRLTKISDWEKAVKFGGFVHTSQAPKSMSDECLGDIIDGKVNEYSSYYLYYYQYL